MVGLAACRREWNDRPSMFLISPWLGSIATGDFLNKGRKKKPNIFQLGLFLFLFYRHIGACGAQCTNQPHPKGSASIVGLLGESVKLTVICHCFSTFVNSLRIVPTTLHNELLLSAANYRKKERNGSTPKPMCFQSHFKN